MEDEQPRPKRIKMKDAQVQDSFKEERKSSKKIQTEHQRLKSPMLTDVSTETEVTPMKQRPRFKEPPREVIQEERRQVDYEIDIDPNEDILEEGELLKFKPGFEKNFI